jgi:methyl-accepting chemotaxis protein
MILKSHAMHLSAEEKKWLSWLGANGKLKLLPSCSLNRGRYAQIEETFQGIAATRQKILIQWAEFNWSFLEQLADKLADHFGDSETRDVLQKMKFNVEDFSELFIIDTKGRIIESSYPAHNGQQDLSPRAVAAGLKAPFLHGPYLDPLTTKIGPSCSKFHDQVTLMFYHPVKRDNQVIGCLCGRIPNDVMSDLIQREAGHVYPGSGDNYIFMLQSNFDTHIKPGTALSRSRFEDDTVCAGDNLKGGIKTDFGTVQIKEHTEFEILFTDPATKALHPGVRETIRKGSNIFVTYPGYADYRHIPVIGAGVSFQLPGSLDRWGMMCEADLAEVYLFRSENVRLCTITAVTSISLLTLMMSISHVLPDALRSPLLFSVLSVFTGLGSLYWFGFRPLISRLQNMSLYFMRMAEGGASLSERIDASIFKPDEIGDLARWINSFVDRTETASNAVLSVVSSVSNASQNLSKLTQDVTQSSAEQNCSANHTAKQIENMIGDIGNVAERADATSKTSESASALSERGRLLIQEVAKEMSNIAQSVVASSKVVEQLEERSNSISGIIKVIGDIADQTNLLALNATIEAARAGEHGRGFAVVADEVKKLSERTSTSTTEIKKMIGSILTETSQVANTMETCNQQVKNGESLMVQAAQSLIEINNGANDAFNMVQVIAKLTQQQHHTGNEIARNIDMITRSAKQNSLSANKSADAAHGLALLGANLRHAVRMITG